MVEILKSNPEVIVPIAIASVVCVYIVCLTLVDIFGKNK